jgi:hypothetical protein
MTSKEILTSAVEQVFSKLGCIYNEVHYQKAVAAELKEYEGTLSCLTEFPIPLMYETSEGNFVCLGTDKCDLIWSFKDEFILVEFKNLNHTVIKEAEAKRQLCRYEKGLENTFNFSSTSLVFFPKTVASKPVVTFFKSARHHVCE